MDHEAHKLLAVSSIRKLWPQRHGRHAADARKAIHQWIKDLRKLRMLDGVDWYALSNGIPHVMEDGTIFHGNDEGGDT